MCKPKDLRWLDQFNTTELAEMCKFNDIPGFTCAGLTKGYPREILKRCLLMLESPPVEAAIMQQRRMLSEYVSRHWESRFRCQAERPQCPECALGQVDQRDNKFKRCTDLQAIDCWIANKENVT